MTYQYTDILYNELDELKGLKNDINHLDDDLQNFYIQQNLLISRLSVDIDELKIKLRWYKFLTGAALATLSIAILLIVHTIA